MATSSQLLGNASPVGVALLVFVCLVSGHWCVLLDAGGHFGAGVRRA